MKKIIYPILLAVIILTGAYWMFGFFSDNGIPFSPSANELPGQNSSLPAGCSSPTTIVAENLDTPWGLVFLPDNSLLITERQGGVRLVENLNNPQPELIATLGNVLEIGEGGLLGITVHPDFSKNNLVYFYYTYRNEGGNTLNRVVRMTYRNKLFENEEIIVDEIPGATNHNGGRIKFGPDGFLYIATGDAQNSSQAQDTASLAGKILRSNDSGEPAPGNPFGNLIYSYGHRNPQGLVWDNNGRLWGTEHGRSGVLSGLDELNLIEAGKNYGWPIIQGGETKIGMETPKLNSGAFNTWAPAGAAVKGGSIFFGGLRGQTLYEAAINEDSITLYDHLKGQFGRIRDVILSPDGFLYITTSNRDGRGNPQAGDDKVIKICGI